MQIATTGMESPGANHIDGQADRPRERERASQSADNAKSCSVDKIDIAESVALFAKPSPNEGWSHAFRTSSFLILTLTKVPYSAETTNRLPSLSLNIA